jgi:death on curing protein
VIPIDEVIAVHEILIERFGRIKGVRDNTALESALGRPLQTFDGRRLYPTIIDQAAALFESMIRNHPFIDGNKRVAYAMLLAVLAMGELDLPTSQKDMYDFILSSAEGTLDYDQIRNWIQTHAHGVL